MPFLSCITSLAAQREACKKAKIAKKDGKKGKLSCHFGEGAVSCNWMRQSVLKRSVSFSIAGDELGLLFGQRFPDSEEDSERRIYLSIPIHVHARRAFLQNHVVTRSQPSRPFEIPSRYIDTNYRARSYIVYERYSKSVLSGARRDR